MISVPNHLPPLSGSKCDSWSKNLAIACRTLCTLLGVGLSFALMSCSFFKPVSSSGSTGSTPREVPTEYGATPGQNKPSTAGNVSVYDPIKGWVTVQTRPQERIDTVRWKDASGPNGPITSDAVRLPNTTTDRGAVTVIPGVPSTNPNPTSPVNRPGQYSNQSTYNVAVLLPFMSGTSAPIANNSVSEWALQYYGGLKMALSVLDQEGIRLNVNVLDTKADTLEMYRLLRQQEVQNAHLLIGPYRRDDIKITAEYAKRNNKPMVSPYSAVGNLTQDNPNYIQINPSLESHCRALLNHALSEFRPEEIVIVTRNVVGEQTCLGYLRKAYEPKRAMGNAAIPEYFLPGESYSGLNLRPYLQGKTQAAVIVPSWADETYIFYLLRAVKSAKATGQKVVVYGMPQWIDFEHMEFDLYEQCQVRISQVDFIDDQSPEVLNFKKEFYNRYSALPKEEAYAGYDQMIYFGRLLANFGPKVSENLERNQGIGLHTGFNFSRIVNNAPFGAEQYAPTQRYENRFVHILEFAGYQFKPLPVTPK